MPTLMTTLFFSSLLSDERVFCPLGPPLAADGAEIEEEAECGMAVVNADHGSSIRIVLQSDGTDASIRY